MDEVQLDMAAVKPTVFSLLLLAAEVTVIITILHWVGVQWPKVPGAGLFRGL